MSERNGYKGEASGKKSKYISAWGYVGWTILFAIPIIGWLINIIFCFSKKVNRRNFARSFWCKVLLCLIINLVLVGGIWIFSKTQAGREVIANIDSKVAELGDHMSEGTTWDYLKELAGLKKTDANTDVVPEPTAEVVVTPEPEIAPTPSAEPTGEPSVETTDAPAENTTTEG